MPRPKPRPRPRLPLDEAPSAAPTAAPAPPRERGRPRLSAEEVRARVAAYCDRYGVVPAADGLPPFPSGRRETAQHREWLTVYRALRRHGARSSTAGAAAGASTRTTSPPCPVCGRTLQPSESTRGPRLDPSRTAPRLGLHEACADLVERLRAAGPQAVARAGRLLWGPRPPD